MTRVLVMTGGPDYAHDFSSSGAALATIAANVAEQVDLVDHPDAVPEALAGCDALVVNGLWWRMLGPAYDQWRDEWAYATTPEVQGALTAFVEQGGGLVANHTGVICFDDWPAWADVVGGAWQWGRSSHPAPAPVTARVVADHPVVRGLPEQFELDDEVYGDLDRRPGIDVLAVARRTPDDDDQPVVWAHRCGKGRVVFDGFGHDAASLADPNHRRLLTQALTWVLEAG